MNTFTFTDDETAIISAALRRYSRDVDRHISELDELGIDGLLNPPIRSYIPAIKRAREKVDRTKEK